MCIYGKCIFLLPLFCPANMMLIFLCRLCLSLKDVQINWIMYLWTLLGRLRSSLGRLLEPSLLKLLHQHFQRLLRMLSTHLDQQALLLLWAICFMPAVFSTKPPPSSPDIQQGWCRQARVCYWSMYTIYDFPMLLILSHLHLPYICIMPKLQFTSCHAIAFLLLGWIFLLGSMSMLNSPELSCCIFRQFGLFTIWH